jgi:hypothetical protein
MTGVEERGAFMSGPRLGWLLGGLGSLLWLPIMAIVWVFQGGLLFPLLGLAVFAVGVAYLFFIAPWRHPGKPIWTLYLGFLGILGAGGVVAVLQHKEALSLNQIGFLPVLWVLVMPFFSFGRKSWADLHPHDR